MKVLIADDSHILRETLKRYLSTLEKIQQIDEAETISKTKQMLFKIHPDVLILDIHMSDGSGFEILDLLKTMSNKPITIIFTNYVCKLYRDVSFKGGANYFFDKSNEFEKMIDVLQTLIHQQIKD